MTPILRGTKGETLLKLQGFFPENTLETVLIKQSDFEDDALSCYQRLVEGNFSNKKLAIRSSSISEDNKSFSGAGKFHSVIGVENTFSAFFSACQNVFSSYGTIIDELDQHLIVQGALENVVHSGVIMTRNHTNGAPYYTINYHIGTDTTAVTSGSSKEVGEFILLREYAEHTNALEFKQLINLCKKLESYCDSDWLDIEYAATNETVYILQVRPIVKKPLSINDAEIKKLVDIGAEHFQSLQTHRYNSFGDKTVLANMPDWNPAEIIGIYPKPFASSLYKEVITNDTWAYQRSNYGYKNLRSNKLMHLICGQPFIDTALSFSSFVPNLLNDDTSHKLVCSYINKLAKQPELQDKVEFEIAHTSYSFDLDDRLKSINEIDDKEKQYLSFELWKITNNALFDHNSLVELDLSKIEKLKLRRDRLLHGKYTTEQKIYWLIQEVKRYGTLPFAGLARAAFMAVELMLSLVRTKHLSEEQSNLFFASLNTVSKQLSKDRKHLPKSEFLQKYGHLRPGTYDISVPSYDEAPEQYFNELSWPLKEIDTKILDVEEIDLITELKLSHKQSEEIECLLRKHRFDISVETFFDRLKLVIEAREYSKFEFTKNIDQIIKLSRIMLDDIDVESDLFPFADISSLLELAHAEDKNMAIENIHTNISKNKELYNRTNLILLPDVISSVDQFYEFNRHKSKPNFVTVESALAESVQLTTIADEIPLKGKVVLIESADPGYDFLFDKNIGGLITCYGGVNSHMAIRCAELNIPAAIGVGELLYSRLTKAKMIDLNCEQKTLVIIE